jgi:nucleoside kinase
VSAPSVIVAGDRLVLDHIVVLDRLPDLGAVVLHQNLSRALGKVHYGGCSANIATSLARLGMPTALASASTDDLDTVEYQRRLSGLGIALDYWTTVKGLNTPHCYCFYDTTGAKLSFMDAIDHADIPRSFSVPDEALTKAPVVVLVGARTDDAWREAMIDLRHRAKSAGCKVVQTLCGPVANIALDAICQADVFICNELEAEWIGRQLGRNAAETLIAGGASAVFVTKGSRGSTVHAGGGRDEIAAVSIHGSAEPTGAGDAYAAGVVACLARGGSPIVAAQWGTTMASFVVEGIGSQPDFPPLVELTARFNSAFGGSTTLPISESA